MKAEVFIGDYGEGIFWDCPFCNAYKIDADKPCPKCGAKLEIEAHQ